MMRRLSPEFYHDAEQKFGRDAGETVFIERAIAAIETESYDTVLPPLKALEFIPIDTSDPEAVSATIYRQYTRVGLARLVNSAGGDVPMVENLVKEFSKKYFRLGAGYRYTLDELLQSQYAMSRGMGRSVDAEKAITARTAIERGLDVIGALGSQTSTTIPGLTTGIGPDVGMLGLLNQPNAGVFTVPQGASNSTLWSTKTPDEIVADIAGILASIKISTYEAFWGNRVLLPTTQMLLIAGKRMGDGSDKTILAFCLENLGKIYPGLVIDSLPYCTLAGTGGTLDRMVAFNDNPRWLKLKVSQRFRQEPPQYHNWEVKVLCSAKTAGVVCPYPISMAYGDGI